MGEAENIKSGVVKKELGASGTDTTCYGLSKNKRYHVWVRAFEAVSGVRIYGKWSAKKSLVIKNKGRKAAALQGSPGLYRNKEKVYAE